MLKPRKNLENLQVYQTDEYFETFDLKLDSNENLYGPSKKVLLELSKIDEDKIKFYPCYGALLDELAKQCGTDKKNILLTNGCDEAVSVIFNTYLEQNDCVVSFSPTFSMPKIYANSSGAKFVEANYDEKWQFDAKKLEKLIDFKAKIIYMTSPNSPTGEVIRYDDVEYFCKNYPNKAIVLDITYSNFALTQDSYYDLINSYHNLFVIKSFSKDYALAGLRLGYVVSNFENILNLKKVISPYSVNNIALIAAKCALFDVEHLENMKNEIFESRRFLIEGLKELGYKPYPSNGNFVLCDFENYCDFIYKKLLTNSCKVRRFELPCLKTSLRITIPKLEDTKMLLNILKPRNLLVFDLDGVIFDVTNSYRLAIERTFSHFAFEKLEKNEIQEAKNSGGLNNDWDLTEHLLLKHNVFAEKESIINVFQRHFFNPNSEELKGLIDNEKLNIDTFLLDKLSKMFDLAVFTGRPREEAYYSLKKFNILKYFSAIVCREDIDENQQKPHPAGLELIKRNTKYNEIFYFGDTSDDIKCALAANATPIGVLPNNMQNREYKKLLLDCGAKMVLNNIGEILKAEVIK